LTFRQFLLTTIAALVIVGVAACMLFKTPLAHASDPRCFQSGIASWYGTESGRRTANGERFPTGEATAAHRTLRFGTRLRVTDQRTRRSVIVRINDRGPYIAGRIIDLSPAAAEELGMHGLAKVCIEIVG
jgi:rare lipoprotein A